MLVEKTYSMQEGSRKIVSVGEYLENIGENLRPHPNYDLQSGDTIKFKKESLDEEILEELSHQLSEECYGVLFYSEECFSFIIQLYTDSTFSETLVDDEGFDITIFLYEVGVENLRLVMN